MKEKYPEQIPNKYCNNCRRTVIFLKIKENGKIYYCCSGDLGKTYDGCGKILHIEKEKNDL